MNKENFEYLKNQVKFTGFGEGLENDLKTKMEGNTPDFQLSHQQTFGKEKTDATLHFRQDDNGLYHFNKYDLKVAGDQEMKQTFFIGNSNKVNIDSNGKEIPEKSVNNNFTLKEAFNMMEGRAVNKDFYKVQKVGEGEGARYEPTSQTYNSWVQLDFKNADDSGNYKVKHFHQNYGFDLQEALAKHPIKELSNESDKTQLVESLQKGNRQSVTFSIDGAEQKRFVEANPQYKSITVYDGSMKRIRMDQKEGETAGQSNKQENKVAQKQKSDEEPKAAKKRSNKQHM
jgi:hypothetical protein